MANDPDPALVERVKRVLSEHIKVDATGLSPAVASAFIVGFYDAALAVLAALRESGRLVPSAATQICEDILTIMQTYHEQDAAGFVDTPGGLEHMGDVWRLLEGWEQMLKREAPPATAATEGK